METWVLISENVEEKTMLNYRLVCSTLAKSAHKAFLLTRFATRRSLPTRKSLEKLLHLLRNDDFGPSIERLILEPIPDNYGRKNRKSDFLFVHEELGFHQIFSAIKARGNKVALEYVESETTCDYLRPHRGSLTYELHGQAFKADYEIPDISVSAIGRYSLPWLEPRMSCGVSQRIRLQYGQPITATSSPILPPTTATSTATSPSIPPPLPPPICATQSATRLTTRP
ncbi:unnamed protein product [Aureobasidium pullulans]|nr:unnamed protein product [Aureobasidium pullulans]